MPAIRVPDVPPPRARLCWRQDPQTLVRCDRRKGHEGACTWQMVAEAERIRTVLVCYDALLGALGDDHD